MRWKPIVLKSCAGCAVALLVAFVLAMLIVPNVVSFIFSSKGRRIDDPHVHRAQELERDGLVDAAIDEWQLVAAGKSSEKATRPLADLLERSGRFDEELRVIDRDGLRLNVADYIDLRSRWLERHASVEAAAAWIAGLDAHQPGLSDWPIALGEFHYYGGRAQRAIEPFLEALCLESEQAGFRFDERENFIYRGDSDEPDRELDRIGILGRILEELSRSYESAGDDERALQIATRAVSFGQRRSRDDGYWSDLEIEGGDFGGRIVRARIYMRRGELELAERELCFADAAVGYYQGNVDELGLALKRFAELRASSH